MHLDEPAIPSPGIWYIVLEGASSHIQPQGSRGWRRQQSMSHASDACPSSRRPPGGFYACARESFYSLWQSAVGPTCKFVRCRHWPTYAPCPYAGLYVSSIRRWACCALGPWYGSGSTTIEFGWCAVPLTSLWSNYNLANWQMSLKSNQNRSWLNRKRKLGLW